MRSDRKHGRDPAAKLVEELLEQIDAGFKLVEMPKLSADVVRKRAEKLSSGEPLDCVANLAELRYYQARQLLTSDEAAAHYEKLLANGKGKLLATGEPHERREAIADLLPK